jgi:hypothetical protein
MTVVAGLMGLGALLFALACPAPAAVTPEEARAIARDAYVYGYPLVDSYRILHAYSVDTDNPEYKGPWNSISSVGRVFTPEDKEIQTPNSDTPYSMVAFDLRAEPLVFTVPEIEAGRYFSIQFIDAYTFNFDYVGSRVTGNGGGHFLLAGPGWKGDAPEGVVKVMRCETELGLAIYRTQLFNPKDIESVRKIQSKYTVQPLSDFLGKKAPAATPVIDFIAPLTPQEQKTSLEFFRVLNFVLGFCPTHPSERETMERFARVGVGAGLPFDPKTLDAAMTKAFADGVADAWKVLAGVEAEVAAGKVTADRLFGTREHLANNYAFRFAGTILGIFANSAAEAMYPAYRVDAAGQALDGSKGSYVLRFAPGKLPPAHAFWSATMYGLPESLLYANPLNRYLINSPMLPDLKKDADGGLSILVQHESPGKDLESNWLPAPKGPFWVALRIYWPKPEALDGTWKRPELELVR